MSSRRTADDEEVVELDMPRPRSISRKPLDRKPEEESHGDRRRESDAQEMQKQSIKADDEALANIARSLVDGHNAGTADHEDAILSTQPAEVTEIESETDSTQEQRARSPVVDHFDGRDEDTPDEEFRTRMNAVPMGDVEEVLRSIREDPEYSIRQEPMPVSARATSETGSSSEKHRVEHAEHASLEEEDPAGLLQSDDIVAMLASSLQDNPTQDQQYLLHHGSRGISPPPGFDDSSIPSYQDSSEVPSYQNVVCQSSGLPTPHSSGAVESDSILPESQRPAMTEKFMNAHIARHGNSSLSPLALLAPDQADALPEYVMSGASIPEDNIIRGRERSIRPIENSDGDRERAKLEVELEAVRAIEEQEAIQAIEAMEALSLARENEFDAAQLSAMRNVGDDPTDYYSPEELQQFQALGSESAEDNDGQVGDDAELLQMMAQYIRRSPSDEADDDLEDTMERMSILRDRELTSNPRAAERTTTGRIDPEVYTISQNAQQIPTLEPKSRDHVPGSSFASTTTRTGIDVEALRDAAIARKQAADEEVKNEKQAAPEQVQYQAGYGGGHGVRKTIVDAATFAAQQAKNNQRAQAYSALSNQINELRQQGDVSREAFDLTTKLLLVNPEYYTIWNYRREIMLQGLFPILDDVAKQELLVSELKRLQAILQDYPKVYWIWTHRKWCLNVSPWPDWSRELLLVTKMLEQDARNFHVWEYRRYVIAQIEQAEESTKAEREFEYTTAAINSNFSNFSAWHNRTKLIPQMLTAVENHEEREERRKVLLKDELELIKGAIYTDPDDQSVWLYHRWLLNPECAASALHPLAPSTTEEHVHHLNEELAMIEELMEEEPDNVWCTFAKVHYTLSLQRITSEAHTPEQTKELQALIASLEQNDALREGRYREWRASTFELPPGTDEHLAQMRTSAAIAEPSVIPNTKFIIFSDLCQRSDWSDVSLHQDGHITGTYKSSPSIVLFDWQAISTLNPNGKRIVVGQFLNNAVTYFEVTRLA